MRAFIVIILLTIMIVSLGYAQEKIDVVYLKNGDVRKGVIIENVPNDYIKIETADGSIFTIKYADIEKMTKEEKPAAMQSAPAQTAKGLLARTSDFGITVGLWLPGDVNVEDFEVDAEKEAGFLLRVYYDAAVAEKISVGAYFHLSPVSSSDFDEGATMIEIGGALKARFPLGDGSTLLIPGLGIGYRMYSSDVEIMDEVDAMGVNFSLQVQFDAHQIFVPYAEIGFLSQPVGGNDITGLSFPPILYFGAGLAF